ncbi:putative small metal-binding protein [Nitrobacteraceae bacterium AZCC 2161]|jgi:predicted small metal-binding protein
MTDVPQQKFDARYVAALREVLDIAVEHIAEEHRTPATKAKMAETIVRNAAEGIIDTQDLLSHAVRAGAEGAP